VASGPSERTITAGERETARIAMWAGMVALADYLQQRELQDAEAGEHHEIGLNVTRALRDGCSDILADVEEHGPPQAAEFWLRIARELAEVPGQQHQTWGEPTLRGALTAETQRLYSAEPVPAGPDDGSVL